MDKRNLQNLMFEVDKSINYLNPELMQEFSIKENIVLKPSYLRAM